MGPIETELRKKWKDLQEFNDTRVGSSREAWKYFTDVGCAIIKRERQITENFWYARFHGILREAVASAKVEGV